MDLSQVGSVKGTTVKSKKSVANGVDLRKILKEFRELYFNRENSITHFKLKLLFISVFNIYFLAIFNSSQVQGNIFTIGILFGLSEALGIMFGERLINLLPDWLGYILSTSVIMACSIIVKIPGIDQGLLYAFFLTQVLFVGISFNIAYMM
jgi:hypothetical protein